MLRIFWGDLHVVLGLASALDVQRASGGKAIGYEDHPGFVDYAR